MSQAKMKTTKLLVIDANVLIDFAEADVTILALVVKHIGTVYVPRPLLREVQQLDESQCAELGLIVVDPELGQLTEVASPRGRLSFEDQLCLVMGRDNGWTCVTNDKRLRQECAACGVNVLWGLQLLIGLVEHGALGASHAIELAERIQRINPYITGEVLVEFKKKANR